MTIWIMIAAICILDVLLIIACCKVSGDCAGEEEKRDGYGCAGNSMR